ncbi:riboflavin synthase [Microbacterium marinilacus]|uniref:Riboflavin synthase n=1 Tax=Microbacterium marinilacus TaxID=415209 RepID=A0ABP7BAV9_9MICO|nr:riboflavin synthase [Microbacterium marinilacus]MBY0687124.1 riboflavin synthase [Microbacterium marinilacus]
MFTGIVEEIGRITAVEPSGDGVRLTLHAPGAVEGVSHGDSIAVSGVCLTVVGWTDDGFTADVMRQTLEMSTLDVAASGTPVNIERATAAGGRLGGHIVQGHIDGTGVVREVRPGAQWRVVRVSLPGRLAPLVVDKGSIAVDGVSLTVSAVSAAGVADPWFEVSLIPETLAATTLGERVTGDRVNLETDILARHVQRLFAFGAPASQPERGSWSFATTEVPAADYSVLDPSLAAAPSAAPTEGGSL